MSRRMPYATWRPLVEAMARIDFQIDAADMMIEAKEAFAAADKLIEKSKATATGAGDVQRWRQREHSMTNAIIALEKLGYRIVKTGE